LETNYPPMQQPVNALPFHRPYGVYQCT
jgi:hypothetical protein